MGTSYSHIKLTESQAALIASELYGIKGKVSSLPGDLDFNFKIDVAEGRFLLKVSRPDTDLMYLEFQQAILQHVADSNTKIESPVPVPNLEGRLIGDWKDTSGTVRKVRMLTWMDGRLWSSVNPVKYDLLFSLGEQLGRLSLALQGFDHPLARRDFEWDIPQAGWTRKVTHLFSKDKQEIATHFQDQFDQVQQHCSTLRKSVVHHDANDNNVVVSEDLVHPQVRAIIDYGDAIHTQLINDVAIAIAYAVMGKPDVLSAALPVVEGYHSQFPLLEKELEVLYTLVAMRLVISVSKSALNRQAEPDNPYLLISETPAWEVLKLWKQVSKDFAHYNFRSACGYTAHSREKDFRNWASKKTFSLASLFPTISRESVHPLDLGVSSLLIGDREVANDLALFQFKSWPVDTWNPGHFTPPKPTTG
jgi:Ser/Thr protein kinase RdoA (MazF antagonist)